ncbi:molybdopterin oxidoreductase [Caloranaerobacter azorensis H53214]|uniref:Molybdopterin oxidoreductase n=1 Tax=Caloranaerobacter azorensis H53214 TaxID=1156417 RepID=A0A096BJA1_9FIRM|nr:DUF1667 domain-containing protein [Caloranaerobacter azorensis]KGG80942.1 molybdopterin oxidoreductase [Caloranaerobacter azorensis H53214]
MKKDMICIVCPIGCHLEIEKDEKSSLGFKVTGNQCKRGQEYAIEEITNPKRILTSTVKIKNAHLSRLPVRTNKPVPKDKIFECMKEINKVEVTAPIRVGDVIIKNILGTGADVLASRDM